MTPVAADELLAWAERHAVDLRSTFDLSDEAFEAIVSTAGQLYVALTVCLPCDDHECKTCYGGQCNCPCRGRLT